MIRKNPSFATTEGRSSRHLELLALVTLLALSAAIRTQYLRERVLEPRFARPTLQAGMNLEWAKASASGYGSRPGAYQPLVAAVPEGPYVHPPGYPMFLAGWFRLVGTNPIWALAFQQLLGVLTVAWLWHAGRRWIGAWGGWTAAVLAALHWTPMYYAGEFLDVAILPTLVLGTLTLWVRCTERTAARALGASCTGRPPVWLLAFAAGLGLGVLVLARPLAAALFGILLAAWSLAVHWRVASKFAGPAATPASHDDLLTSAARSGWRHRFGTGLKRLRGAAGAGRLPVAAGLVGVLVLVAPVTWRNVRASGHFVPVCIDRPVLSLVGALPRYDGLDDSDTGTGNRLDRASTYALLAQAAGSDSPRAIRRHFRQRLRTVLRQFPEESGWILARRVQLFWNPLEVGDARVVEYDRRSSALLRRLSVPNALLFGMAVLGLALRLWSRRATTPPAPPSDARQLVAEQLPALLLLVLLAWSLAHLSFLASGLWRHPMLPAVLLAGGWAMEDLRASLARRRARDILGWCACAALVVWTLSLNLGRYVPNRAAWLLDRGIALEAVGEQDAADVAFRTALLATPGLVDPGTGARGSGPVLSPSDVRRYHGSAALACMKLAQAAVHDANPLLAVRYYQLAAELDPARSDALVNAGTLLLRERRPMEAAQLLRQALARDARAFPALFPLAQALYRLGEYDEARVQLDRLLDVLPDHQAASSLRALLAVELDATAP